MGLRLFCSAASITGNQALTVLPCSNSLLAPTVTCPPDLALLSHGWHAFRNSDPVLFTVTPDVKAGRKVIGIVQGTGFDKHGIGLGWYHRIDGRATVTAEKALDGAAAAGVCVGVTFGLLCR